MQYTETELNKLIETVEKEFSTVLTKAESNLAKSESVNSTALSKGEEPPKKDEKPSHKEDKAPESEEGEEKHADGEAKPQADAAPAAAPMENDGHGYDDEDMQHMDKMYASMSKAELKVHHDAVKRCLDALAGHGGGPSGQPQPSAPAQKLEPQAMGKAEHSDGLIKPSSPKGSPGAQSPASKDQKNLSNMEKGEEATRESGGKIEKTSGPKGSPGAQSPASKDQGNLHDMEKSEKSEFDLLKSELEAQKAKNDELKKGFDGVQEFLTKLVKKVPQAKAITSMEQIAKSEGVQEMQELSKSEVTQVLLRKSSDPTLSKTDRDAINAYYLGGANFNTISHLLKN